MPFPPNQPGDMLGRHYPHFIAQREHEICLRSYGESAAELEQGPTVMDN